MKTQLLEQLPSNTKYCLADKTTEGAEEEGGLKDVPENYEYDDSWDYLYDHNEFENKKRKLNKSKKIRYNKQEW